MGNSYVPLAPSLGLSIYRQALMILSVVSVGRVAVQGSELVIGIREVLGPGVGDQERDTLREVFWTRICREWKVLLPVSWTLLLIP